MGDQNALPVAMVKRYAGGEHCLMNDFYREPLNTERTTREWGMTRTILYEGGERGTQRTTQRTRIQREKEG